MLAEAGISDRAVRTRLRHGELVRIARGTYMTREDVEALGPVGVHLARARLVGSHLDADEALSHVTAAVVHGLDVWDAPLGRIHVTRRRCAAAG